MIVHPCGYLVCVECRAENAFVLVNCCHKATVNSSGQHPERSCGHPVPATATWGADRSSLLLLAKYESAISGPRFPLRACSPYFCFIRLLKLMNLLKDVQPEMALWLSKALLYVNGREGAWKERTHLLQMYCNLLSWGAKVWFKRNNHLTVFKWDNWDVLVWDSKSGVLFLTGSRFS